MEVVRGFSSPLLLWHLLGSKRWLLASSKIGILLAFPREAGAYACGLWTIHWTGGIVCTLTIILVWSNVQAVNSNWTWWLSNIFCLLCCSAFVGISQHCRWGLELDSFCLLGEIFPNSSLSISAFMLATNLCWYLKGEWKRLQCLRPLSGTICWKQKLCDVSINLRTLLET